jgi:DNA-binding NarL/FixJ family response regulator
MKGFNLAISQLDLGPAAPDNDSGVMAPPPPLSPRERQVVALLQTGLSRKEVAYELGLNDATVRVHLWHARRKARRTH